MLIGRICRIAAPTLAAMTLVLAQSGYAQYEPPHTGPQSGKRPPPQAFEDCRGKTDGDVVQHSTPEGMVSATCVNSPDGLVARPDRPSNGRLDRMQGKTSGADDRRSSPSTSSNDQRQQSNRKAPQGGGHGYSLEQAVSDNAQLHTIAFNGLAFITGSFGASTFIPPGKVSDFFGFQYMRDIDAAGKGHNPQFLDRVAGNVLSILDAGQLELFRNEAAAEATQLKELAFKRLPLISAFHAQLDGKIPTGSSGLNLEAVKRYAGDMFTADATLAYQRATIFGRIASSLTGSQKSALARMHFGDFNSWPAVDMERYKLPRGTDHLVNVAYMTLGSEFFSWYAGSLEADTYFCPERHGTYFGGFFLKDMPAMGKRDYDISTALTGDLGEQFLQQLNQEQRRLMTDIIDRQRKPLAGIVEVRRAISTELRRFMNGGTADLNKVLALGRQYGELDGELAYIYATTFARIAATLSPEQRATLKRLRNGERYVAAPAYLYSDPISQAPSVTVATTLFFSPI
ncbi:MAG: Spy/CpxP family protein refolding chaperone [Rhodospirillaceae bacterium]